MKYKVTLNNRTYEVEVEAGQAMLIDEYEAYVPAPPPIVIATPITPAPVGTLVPGDVVRSPMPGNILKVNVIHGQEVEEGDVLIILEALKMENEIVAMRSGKVAQIVVNNGDVVETDSPLLVIS